MTKDTEGTITLTPLDDDVLRAATAYVCQQPDADLLLDMLGLAGVAP